ncbi:hypothetical protein QWI17_12245 [Gilvimarinus sp. SDUM040013]|uniref:Uncharacterized protein n=1 Tax=Gilvimarinus gilvus TaxID=3058038 RepID=A0ABU4RX80_9GAMM|nr:hypothetical protein [Gilvimarinus sp. SDUM040013]MDO3386608.1 hypothetical protein [Gilvimarinus sp. SDUM040013]MDX6849505.1 hypothetical protein [Gilvimarinus sp. SDUM040013]
MAGQAMKYLNYLALLFCSLSALAGENRVDDAVAASVGRILLYQDINTDMKLAM